jgi:hypothetical protein
MSALEKRDRSRSLVARADASIDPARLTSGSHTADAAKIEVSMERRALLPILAAFALLQGSGCPLSPSQEADPDRDGLETGWEAQWGIDPQRADTDADGAPDGIEVLLATDPTDPSELPRDFPTYPMHSGTFVYAASHDESGAWELTATFPGDLERPFALLGRPNGGARFGLTADHHGFLYAARDFTLARVHPFTGAVDRVLELREATGAPVVVQEIAFDPTTLELYGVERSALNGYGYGREIVRIDRASGLVTRTGVVLPMPAHALAFRLPDAGAPSAPALFLAFDVALGVDAIAMLDFGDPGNVELTDLRVPSIVQGIALDPFDLRGAPLYAATYAPSLGEIAGGSMWRAMPRGIGAIAVPPPCPAPCYGELRMPVLADIVAGELSDRDSDGAVDAVLLVMEDGPDDPHGLEVWRNDGAAGFALASATPTPAVGLPSLTAALELQDFVGDSSLDAAILLQTDVAILPGNAGGGFETETLRLPGRHHTMDSGDVTGDGRADVVVAGDSGVRVFASDGAGAFAEPLVVDPEFFPLRIALASRGGGGGDSIVATDVVTIAAYEPDGSGGWSRSLVAVDSAFGWSDLASGDLDGDGADEIVAMRWDAIDVLRRNASGSWDSMQLPMPLDVTAQPWPPSIGDATGDGRADVVVPVYLSGTGEGVAVLVGDGSGALVWSLAPLDTLLLWGDGRVALGDLDGNGLLDAVRFAWGHLGWLPNGSSFPEPD